LAQRIDGLLSGGESLAADFRFGSEAVTRWSTTLGYELTFAVDRFRAPRRNVHRLLTFPSS